jgi:succinate dehydrogenase/fumarate reductase cytochrome b subunit
MKRSQYFQETLTLLKSITDSVAMNRIMHRLSGVIGMMMAQLVVSGMLMAGTKNGASGKMIGAGSSAVRGRRI